MRVRNRVRYRCTLYTEHIYFVAIYLFLQNLHNSFRIHNSLSILSTHKYFIHIVTIKAKTRRVTETRECRRKQENMKINWN